MVSISRLRDNVVSTRTREEMESRLLDYFKPDVLHSLNDDEIRELYSNWIEPIVVIAIEDEDAEN